MSSDITLCVHTKNLLISGNHSEYSPRFQRVIMKYRINFHTNVRSFFSVFDLTNLSLISF